jgi:transposase
MGKEAKYVVRLELEEWQQLTDLVSKGRGAAAVLRRARVLLKADVGQHGPGWTDQKIVEAVDVSQSTVYRVRQAFVEEGLEAALYRKKPTGRQYRKLDGRQEAHLIAVACSAPPRGRNRWTLKLLADKLVQLEIVESIGTETVRRTLKKTTLSLG